MHVFVGGNFVAIYERWEIPFPLHWKS